jgi:hypothetical protein
MVSNKVMQHVVDKLNVEQVKYDELKAKYNSCSDVGMKVSYGASMALHKSVIDALKEVVEVMLKEVG